MRRGQVSFDLILATVAALIAFGSIAAVSNAIIGLQDESSVRQQLDSIGNSLAAVISTAAVLDDADSASISYTVPKIAVPGEEQLQQCDISIANDKITLSYDIVDLETGVPRTVIVEKKFVDPTGMSINPTQTKCGGTVAISK